MEKVAILLATYQPNMDYLAKQLDSLQHQTYQNCVLYVRDDSDNDEWFQKISTIINEKITTMPIVINRNERNVGSTKTFELLTAEAQAEYFVYCDQDDYWHANKIERLYEQITQQQGLLAYSDLRVIDEQANIIAESFAKMNKRIVHQVGTDTFGFFIRRNCVTGCAMMIKATIAKAAMPFLDAYIHDHWLALVSSQQGNIVFVDEALVDYRIHEQNQIGKTLLKNIEKKADYIPLKLLPEQEKLARIEQRFELNQTQQQVLHEQQDFVQARLDWFEQASFKHLKTLCSFWHLDRTLVLFEIVIRLLPDAVVKRLLTNIKN